MLQSRTQQALQAQLLLLLLLQRRRHHSWSSSMQMAQAMRVQRVQQLQLLQPPPSLPQPSAGSRWVVATRPVVCAVYYGQC